MSLESALEEIARKLDSADFVKVGYGNGDTYPSGIPVATVAAIQNYGAPAAGIPARPFFSSMVKEKSPAWGKQLVSVLKANGYDAAVALGMMGEHIKSQLQDSVKDTTSPPLSPVTVMLRGMRSKGVEITGKTVGAAAERVKEGKTNYGASTTPLVDLNGFLINKVWAEVK